MTGTMRLCVVTDIFSLPAPAECLSTGLSILPDVTRFELNALCGRPDLTGEALHRHLFEESGMDVAVRALRQAWDGEAFALGYSAGGTAIWRAVAEGLPFAGVFCVSSTRLRGERRIAARNHVFFGAGDRNRPSSEWLASVPGQATIFQGVGHNYYLQPSSDAVRGTCAAISQDMRSIAALKTP